MPALRPLHLLRPVGRWLARRRCALRGGHVPETSMVFPEGGRVITCSHCDEWWRTWQGAYCDARRGHLRMLARIYTERGAPVSPNLRVALNYRGIKRKGGKPW